MTSLDEALRNIQQRYNEYLSKPFDREISPSDDMANSWDVDNAHYFAVGAGAVELIFEAMFLCRVSGFRRILDMPCGFGRVTRHLRAAFPEAAINACDLYQDRIDFCGDRLGALPIKSQEDFDQIKFPTTYDLIWCGSLLTHLTAPQFQSALNLFIRALSPNGIAVVTLHGRHSIHIQHNKWKYLPDEDFRLIEWQYYSTGFGYADYKMPDRFFEQKSYGVSVSTPAYVLRCLEKDESIRIKGYMERRWDDHQDALIIQKTALNA